MTGRVPEREDPPPLSSLLCLLWGQLARSTGRPNAGRLSAARVSFPSPPASTQLNRRAIQLGLSGPLLADFIDGMPVSIEDITPFLGTMQQVAPALFFFNVCVFFRCLLVL